MTTTPEEHTPVINQGFMADTPDGTLPVGHTLPDGEALLSVRNLKKTYYTDGGDIEAVRNLTFDLPKGELTCLVGPSGSGKATLLNAISRLPPSLTRPPVGSNNTGTALSTPVLPHSEGPTRPDSAPSGSTEPRLA